MPGWATPCWPAHALDETTTQAPDGRQHATGHGFGRHAVYGPSHVRPSAMHACGVVIVHAPLVAQHAPRHGVGEHAVSPGSRYPGSGQPAAEFTTRHCPFGRQHTAGLHGADGHSVPLPR